MSWLRQAVDYLPLDAIFRRLVGKPPLSQVIDGLVTILLSDAVPEEERCAHAIRHLRYHGLLPRDFE